MPRESIRKLLLNEWVFALIWVIVTILFGFSLYRLNTVDLTPLYQLVFQKSTLLLIVVSVVCLYVAQYYIKLVKEQERILSAREELAGLKNEKMEIMLMKKEIERSYFKRNISFKVFLKKMESLDDKLVEISLKIGELEHQAKPQ